MVNTIQTIRNLKEQFPRFQIDTILQIVECISEEPNSENGILIQPTKKNHISDKTSNNQKVIENGN